MPIRAVLTNIGSLGNVQPFLSLAYELRRGGYAPVLALAPQFRLYVESLGFEFIPIGRDLDYADLQKRDTEAERQGKDPLQMFSESLAVVKPMMSQMLDELMAGCRHADVLISGHLQPVSRMVHELAGVPIVSIHTNHFGQAQPQAFRDAACSMINPFRHALGLPPLADPLHTDANSPQLALYAISKYLRAPSLNWPKHYHTTGFFYLDDESWTPPENLAAFLDAGEAPVVFGFSSIAHTDPQAVTNILLESIARVGCRAIIQSGWSGLAMGAQLPSSVFSIGFVQHTWLFTRAVCVVHAGGSGNTATALRSGVPTIVVPHIGDQPLWAEMVRGLGCSKAIIPYPDLTVERLTTALEQTLADRRLYQQAASVGTKIAAERGVTRARHLITNLLVGLGVLDETTP